jgi:hypothetical protein
MEVYKNSQYFLVRKSSHANLSRQMIYIQHMVVVSSAGIEL